MPASSSSADDGDVISRASNLRDRSTAAFASAFAFPLREIFQVQRRRRQASRLPASLGGIEDGVVGEGMNEARAKRSEGTEDRVVGEGSAGSGRRGAKGEEE